MRVRSGSEAVADACLSSHVLLCSMRTQQSLSHHVQALPKKTIDPDHGETILPITDAQEPLISSTTLHGHSGPLGEWESDEIAAVGLCK